MTLLRIRIPSGRCSPTLRREIKSENNGYSGKLIILKSRKLTVLSGVSVEGNVGVIVVMLSDKWSLPR